MSLFFITRREDRALSSMTPLGMFFLNIFGNYDIFSERPLQRPAKYESGTTEKPSEHVTLLSLFPSHLHSLSLSPDSQFNTSPLSAFLTTLTKNSGFLKASSTAVT